MTARSLVRASTGRRSVALNTPAAPAAPESAPVSSADVYGPGVWRVPGKPRRVTRTTARPADGGKVSVTYDRQILAARMAAAAAAIRARTCSVALNAPNTPAAPTDDRPTDWCDSCGRESVKVCANCGYCGRCRHARDCARSSVGESRWVDTVAGLDDSPYASRRVREELLPRQSNSFTGGKGGDDERADDMRQTIAARKADDVHAIPVLPVGSETDCSVPLNIDELPLAHAWPNDDPKRGSVAACGVKARSRATVVHFDPASSNMCPDCLHVTYLRAMADKG